MDTRVSMQSMYQTAMAGTEQISDQLEQLQAEGTTGLKYSQVSDNPTASLQIISNTDQQQALTAYLGNIQSATASLNASGSALQQVNTIFSQAKSIALQGASSTNTTESDSAMADQVNQLLNNLLDAANTQDSNGAYVFGGTATTTPPYTATRDAAGNIVSVSYQASNAPSSVVVDTNQQAEVYTPGNQVFQGNGADAFQSLITLRDELNNTGNLSQTDQINALSAQAGAVDAANNQVLTAQGSQSATLQSLTSLQGNLQNVQLAVKENIGNLGSADLTDVVVQLQSYEQLLQLSFTTFSQITSTSLLNYLH